MTRLRRGTNYVLEANPPIEVKLQMSSDNTPIGIRVNGKRNNLMQLRGIYVNPYKRDNYGIMPLAMASLNHIKRTFNTAVIDQAVIEWYKREELFRAYLKQVTERPFPIKNLYPHQQAGVAFIKASRLVDINDGGVKVLLADDPRLGKTVQAICSFDADEDFPILVLCLKSLTSYWREQFSLWGNDVNVTVLNGSIPDRHKQAYELLEMGGRSVIITNWQFLRGISSKQIIRLRKHFSTLIGDEAHIIKNPDSLLYKSVNKFRTKNTLLLTATPTEQGVHEYFSYLKLLRPMEFGSFWKFATQFTILKKGAYGTEIGKAKNKPLLRDLITPIVLRRSAKETVTVPDKVHKNIRLEPTRPFLKAYKDISTEVLIEIADQELEIPNALAKLTRLRQLSSFPAMLGYDGVRTPKVDALVDILKNSAASEKFVLYAAYRDTIWYLMHELKEHGLNIVRYTGKESTLRNFESSKGVGLVKALITTPELGGVGIDLSVARSIIFYDIPWSSIVYRQSVERTTKIGMTEPRHIITLIASKVDQYMSDLMQSKLENINSYSIVENLIKVIS